MPETERTNAEYSGSNRDITNDQQLTEREAYFQALRLWIMQAQMYQNFTACLPIYMPFQNLQVGYSNTPLLNNNYQIQAQWPLPPFVQLPRNIPAQPTPNENLTPVELISRYGGYEYVIPPLYKRLIAEFIDFLLLFIVKLGFTFMAVHLFEFIDLEKFSYNEITKNLENYTNMIEMTWEIVFLELCYRIIVCFFEASCLSSGRDNRSAGATPGKALLGIRVISAVAILPVHNRPKETVLIWPARRPTFLTALCRSIVKNVLISLLFPLCLIFFVFQHKRTIYDVVCNVVVVEENMYPPRRNQP